MGERGGGQAVLLRPLRQSQKAPAPDSRNAILEAQHVAPKRQRAKLFFYNLGAVFGFICLKLFYIHIYIYILIMSIHMCVSHLNTFYLGCLLSHTFRLFSVSASLANNFGGDQTGCPSERPERPFEGNVVETRRILLALG